MAAEDQDDLSVLCVDRKRFSEACSKQFRGGNGSKAVCRNKYESAVRFLSGVDKGNTVVKRWIKAAKDLTLENTPTWGNVLLAPASGTMNSEDGTPKTWRRVAVIEDFYDILLNSHTRTLNHGGYKLLFKEVEKSYAFVPRDACRTFVSMCSVCQLQQQSLKLSRKSSGNGALNEISQNEDVQEDEESSAALFCQQQLQSEDEQLKNLGAGLRRQLAILQKKVDSQAKQIEEKDEQLKEKDAQLTQTKLQLLQLKGRLVVDCSKNNALRGFTREREEPRSQVKPSPIVTVFRDHARFNSELTDTKEKCQIKREEPQKMIPDVEEPQMILEDSEPQLMSDDGLDPDKEDIKLKMEVFTEESQTVSGEDCNSCAEETQQVWDTDTGADDEDGLNSWTVQENVQEFDRDSEGDTPSIQAGEISQTQPLPSYPAGGVVKEGMEDHSYHKHPVSSNFQSSMKRTENRNAHVKRKKEEKGNEEKCNEDGSKENISKPVNKTNGGVSGSKTMLSDMPINHDAHSKGKNKFFGLLLADPSQNGKQYLIRLPASTTPPQAANDVRAEKPTAQHNASDKSLLKAINPESQKNLAEQSVLCERNRTSKAVAVAVNQLQDKKPLGDHTEVQRSVHSENQECGTLSVQPEQQTEPSSSKNCDSNPINSSTTQQKLAKPVSNWREYGEKQRGEKPYVCTECKVAFGGLSGLQRHIRKEHTGERFICEVCGAAFLDKSVLVNHNRVHTGEKPFDCKFCGAAFKQKCQLHCHMISHTNRKPHSCSVCGATFKRTDSLNKHVRKHSGKTHACKECGKTFFFRYELMLHEKKHAGWKPNKKHLCDQCGAAFATAYALTLHVRNHTGEKPCVCKECDATFTKPSQLKTHRLRVHLKNNQLYLCHQCGASFMTPYSLKGHMRLHTQEKAFKCQQCDAAFKIPEQLKAHMGRKHSHERPYACNMCELKFKTPQDRKKHQLLHTGKRPYVCDKCGKSYVLPNRLKEHMKLHTGLGALICKKCGKVCIGQSSFESHERSHSNKRPFACDECDATYKQPQHLVSHKRKKHTEQGMRTDKNSTRLPGQ